MFFLSQVPFEIQPLVAVNICYYFGKQVSHKLIIWNQFFETEYPCWKNPNKSSKALWQILEKSKILQMHKNEWPFWPHPLAVYWTAWWIGNLTLPVSVLRLVFGIGQYDLFVELNQLKLPVFQRLNSLHTLLAWTQRWFLHLKL